MSTNVQRALSVLVMVSLIVGVDVLFLRHHVWARLAVNAGILAAFGALHLVSLKRS